GPNFHEIPINRPIAQLSNNQRDGHMRQQIDPGRVSYQPNSLGDNEPAQVPSAAGGYVTYPQATEGAKVRARGESFFDHYGQARMFFQSQSAPEKAHLIKALRFELGMVMTPEIRERVVHHLAQIDSHLATTVAKGLGIELKGNVAAPPNRSVPADGDPRDYQHRQLVDRDIVSDPLSMAIHVPGPITSRKVAILVAQEFDGGGVASLIKALTKAGAKGVLVGPHLGAIPADDGTPHEVQFSILTTSSVLFDAVFVAAGPGAAAWTSEADAVDFVRDAYKHCKTVGATGEGVALLEAAHIPVGSADKSDPADQATIVGTKLTNAATARFLRAMAGHRLWTREPELHLHL
nr:DJ-1/PfpI family protein [Chloroflexota bacterium]